MCICIQIAWQCQHFFCKPVSVILLVMSKMCRAPGNVSCICSVLHPAKFLFEQTTIFSHPKTDNLTSIMGSKCALPMPPVRIGPPLQSQTLYHCSTATALRAVLEQKTEIHIKTRVHYNVHSKKLNIHSVF